MPAEAKLRGQAPDFALPRDGGGEIALSKLRGGKIVLSRALGAQPDKDKAASEPDRAR